MKEVTELVPYIGTKRIEARPMTRGDYNIFKGWTIPENENPADEGYLVEYTDEYVSWSPKDIFEQSYIPEEVVIKVLHDVNDLPPHQKRVLIEGNELSEKLKKLENFLEDRSDELKPNELALMKLQATVMKHYLNILRERIKIF